MAISPWFHRLALPLSRVVAGIAFFLLGPMRVVGKYRVPRMGGVLILANHISDCDPVAIQYACPRHVRFMAKSELFAMKLIGAAAKFYGAFPVKRGEPDRESIRTAVELLKSGQPVCIFPEGQLSETGELQELKSGVALIIRMAQCPVICCGLKNTNRIIPYGSMIPRPAFRTVTAAWGEPREFEKGDSQETVLAWIEGQLRELTD